MATTQNVAAVNTSNFASEVEGASVPVVVDFYAEWCGPCKMIAPVLDTLAGEYEGRVKVVKVNVDQDPDLANRYGVSSIPNLLFFKGGEVVDQVVGYSGRDALVAKIDSLT